MRLGDVARVDIGAENYGTIARLNGKPAAGIGIKLAPGRKRTGYSGCRACKIRTAQAIFPGRRDCARAL